MVFHVRRFESRGELEFVVEGFGDVNLQVVVALGPVPWVGNVPAVHDLSEDVPEVLPRHARVRVDVQEQHLGADRQVAVVEAVLAAPALRAEAPPPAHDGVEEAEREEHGLEVVGLRGLVDAILRELVPGAEEVRLDVGWGLVGHFDATLHQGLGHVLHIVEPGWLGADEAPEHVVSILLDDWRGRSRSSGSEKSEHRAEENWERLIEGMDQNIRGPKEQRGDN